VAEAVPPFFIVKLRRVGPPVFGLVGAERYVYCGGGSNTSGGATRRSVEIICRRGADHFLVVTADAGYERHPSAQMVAASVLRPSPLSGNFGQDELSLAVYESPSTWHALGEAGPRWVEVHGMGRCPRTVELRELDVGEIQSDSRDVTEAPILESFRREAMRLIDVDDNVVTRFRRDS
jgi:hypothetical protein